MKTRECARCGDSITRKHARYCDPCRVFTRGKPPKYARTREKNQVLRDRYDGTVKYRAREIAQSLGWPTWVVKKRAAAIGLTQPVERHDWSAEEIEFLRRHAGKRTANWIAKQLHRSMTSVVLKFKRLKISRKFNDGYTLRRLEACFGCDHKIIQTWIQSGKLQAQRRATERSLDAWYTTDLDVLRFILRYPQEFRLHKVDQPWFMGLILQAFRKPMPVPVSKAVEAPTKALEPAPPGTECALCGRPIQGLATREQRPSGPEGSIETWWYCRQCKRTGVAA